MHNIAIADLIPIVLYLVLLFWLGFKSRRNHPSQEEFLLSGRSLTIPAFVATLVTTWYGGILGIGEFVHKSGISAWLMLGLPYYIFAIIYALWLAPRIRNSGAVSIPDMLQSVYGKKAGLIGGVFLIIMTSPAPYILMLGVLLQMLFGFGFYISIIAGTVISIVYVYWGGFRSVVATDKLQFVFMFGGFILLLIFLIADVSPVEMIGRLDEGHTSLSGHLTWQEIVVWFLIACWTFIDPGFHQRCAAAKTPKTAQYGILISVGFWFVFDTLTITCGLYAFVLYPQIDPLTAYPYLASLYLPVFLRGIFYTGLMAIIMSTIDSYTFLSALSFGNDIILKLKNNHGHKDVVNTWIRIGLIFTGLVSIGLIIAMPSVISLWYNLGSLFIPPLIIPLVAGFSEKLRPSPVAVIIMMCISFGISFGWYLIGQLNSVNGSAVYPLGMEPFFPGMLFSILSYITDLLCKAFIRNVTH
ncbi:MAG: sodium:solute symporter family protein [Calditrichaceae bacterium]|nr:sodium:solute symporter family protein [Calditrichaceae bacterium]MBN2709486.1 sodium:solute symporter family protein [Calditrichaceae bacterium]RQV94811.1 MAG: sodium:solute symporter family protein [Calditrichota bacterium]